MGKTGKTVYPKMFNLGSPFSMEVTPIENKKSRLQKRGDRVAAKHSEEFDKMDMGQDYNERKLARLDRKSDRIQRKINKQ
jgi:hypothetical protein